MASSGVSVGMSLQAKSSKLNATRGDDCACAAAATRLRKVLRFISLTIKRIGVGVSLRICVSA